MHVSWRSTWRPGEGEWQGAGPVAMVITGASGVSGVSGHVCVCSAGDGRITCLQTLTRYTEDNNIEHIPT